MATSNPEATLARAFSDPNATARPWPEAVAVFEQAETFSVTTIRPNGRPHMTTLMAIWLDDALYFCTGATERKAKNLAQNPACILSTGCNAMSKGFDIVVEGDADRVSDEALLQRLADAYGAKYGKYGWHFDVRDGVLHSDDGGDAIVFKVAPQIAFGFGKGDLFSQTRWRFSTAQGTRP